MTAVIWSRWLRDLNMKMRFQKRNIILFVDNCSAHKAEETYSKIRIEFLPANTTALIQPCDQGIIRNFKCHYRSFVLRQMLDHLDKNPHLSSSSKDFVTEMTLLDALRYVVAAWSRVKEVTIRNCFIKSGFIELELPEPEAVFVIPSNPLLNETTLNQMIEAEESCPTRTDMTDSDVVELVKAGVQSNSTIDEEEEEDVSCVSLPTPTLREALDGFKLVMRFFEGSFLDQQSFAVYTGLGNVEDTIYRIYQTNSRQTTLSEYFKSN